MHSFAVLKQGGRRVDNGRAYYVVLSSGQTKYSPVRPYTALAGNRGGIPAMAIPTARLLTPGSVVNPTREVKRYLKLRRERHAII